MKLESFPLLLVPYLFAVPAAAQIVNPADRSADRPDSETDQFQLDEYNKLPPVVVTDQGLGLVEEQPVGPYGQPRWTDRRLFPTTRVYVRPPGTVEFEYWTRAKVPREGQTTVENQYELEFGLPGRFQLDLYAVASKTGSEGELDVAEQKFELRYALADWDELWLNPTVYAEYVERSGESDKVEFKLLLADELGRGWHFGSNLVFEHELGGELENEYGLTLGLAHSVIDNEFSLGAEVKAALLDVHSDRGNYAQELEVGPSLRYRPSPNMHIDFAPLIGIGGESRAADIFLVVGWQF